MSAENLFIEPKAFEYLQGLLPPHPILEKMHIDTLKTFGIPMQLSLDALHFIRFLIPLIAAKNILELGTYTGISSFGMAEVLPPEGKVVTCDRSEEFTAFAKAQWALYGMQDKITLRLGEVADTLQTLIEEKAQFDLIFIDADKPGYPEYVEASLNLLNPKGLILLDNVFLKGAVFSESPKETVRGMQVLNASIVSNPRLNSSFLPFGDGLCLLSLRP
jgi:O-methyltransferase